GPRADRPAARPVLRRTRRRPRRTRCGAGGSLRALRGVDDVADPGVRADVAAGLADGAGGQPDPHYNPLSLDRALSVGGFHSAPQAGQGYVRHPGGKRSRGTPGTPSPSGGSGRTRSPRGGGGGAPPVPDAVLAGQGACPWGCTGGMYRGCPTRAVHTRCTPPVQGAGTHVRAPAKTCSAGALGDLDEGQAAPIRRWPAATSSSRGQAFGRDSPSARERTTRTPSASSASATSRRSRSVGSHPSSPLVISSCSALTPMTSESSAA